MALVKTCECGKPFLFAKVLADDGSIKLKPDGKPQWMPVDYDPVPDGNVILYQRGDDLVAKVLKEGELPAPGEKRRFAHHKTCEQRAKFQRQRGRGRGGRGRR